jgi:hypothetical protein
MKRMTSGCLIAGFGLVLAGALPAGAQDLQQKVEAAKQKAALNQQALRTYSWMEKTDIRSSHIAVNIANSNYQKVQ